MSWTSDSNRITVERGTGNIPDIPLSDEEKDATEDVSVTCQRHKLRTAVDDLQEIFDAGNSARLDRSQLPIFQGMYDHALSLFNRASSLYEEIIDMKGAVDTLETDKQLRQRAKSLYYGISTLVKTLGADRASTAPACSTAIEPSVIGERTRAKLPTIEVPSFDGQRINWTRFRDTFESMIVNDNSFSDIDRYHYLVHALKGSAAAIIAPVTFSAADFHVAWKTLLDVYDNQRLLATAYLDKLLNMPSLPTRPSTEQLKQVTCELTEWIASFKNLVINDRADFLLFYLIRRVLDKTTLESFEQQHDQSKFPFCADILKFLRGRCIANELAAGIGSPITAGGVKHFSSPQSPFNKAKPILKPRFSSAQHTLTVASPNYNTTSNNLTKPRRANPSNVQRSTEFTANSCPLCDIPHTLLNCPRFTTMAANQRVQGLSKWKGCRNCLFSSHPTHRCLSRVRCRFCGGRHHSMLHVLKSEENKPSSNCKNQPLELSPPASLSVSQTGSSRTSQSLNSVALESQNVLLGTALCTILDCNGEPHTIRLALDSGSQFSFITYEAASHLGLTVKPCSVNVMGIGQTPFHGFKGKTDCQLVSTCEPTILPANVLVIDAITSKLPSSPMPAALRKLYENYSLADPNFGDPQPIDFLLGSDLFLEVLTGEIITPAAGQPKLIGTVFGYVIIGRITDLAEAHSVQTLCAMSSKTPPDEPALLADLQRLWELDDPVTPKISNPADIYCEQFFRETHSRLPSGRYIVRLPFKDGKPPKYLPSKGLAIKRLSHVESKLARNQELRTLYSEFMQEYEDLGHMELAEHPAKYVIPHHGVVKTNSDGKPKIRVVFDASARTVQGSLNDFLHVGPKLHNDIVQIMLNFRRHKFCFTVDLKHMFRQILVHKADRRYQHIYWRKDASSEVTEYELTTVTYGMACAPYLAIRSLHQLAQDHGTEFPLAAAAIINYMYVDDLPTGASTLPDALELQRQVIQLMSKAELPLSKWASNHPALLEVVDLKDRAGSQVVRKIENPDDRCRLKILGLQWDPSSDCFSYEVCVPEVVHTKRAILAAVSRIYDPLGLLGPVVIAAKVLIQLAWKAGLEWDEPLPPSIQNKWQTFVAQLKLLSQLHIPRCVCPDPSSSYDLLVFGDASETAYCAAAYLKATTLATTNVSLLISKVRLAPVKPVSIPRLELCAALLVARLVEKLIDFCNQLPRPPKIYLFSDSTVVLGWLQTPPHLLKTFVANRVVRILEVTSSEQWFHVPSQDNPSDLGSRGLDPGQLLGNSLWFNGPQWALEEPSHWPVRSISPPFAESDPLPELKPITSLLVNNEEEPYLIKCMAKLSSYFSLMKIIAWTFRFYNNCKLPKNLRSFGPLSYSEVERASNLCLKVSQEHGFNSGRPITVNSMPKSLLALNPLLDEFGVLRVGGRIGLANVGYAVRHPAILPERSHLAQLIIADYHGCLGHPGPTVLLSLIRRKFWIVGARKRIRKYTRDCVPCRKLYARPCQPMMANLPAERLQGHRAFLNVGVDFAGPFLIKESLRRKACTSKCYLCLFICMGSKAIHLEAVSSLSTAAFIAALDRFVGRRGLPAVVFSDNGTNFVGASNHLAELYRWYRLADTKNGINNYALSKNISWRFTPPHAPHFGGIWEAGVRSAKRLIRAVFGEGAFTFEELSTLFCKVEGILNSRPICPLSNDPADLDALTPGHLLIGSPILDIPEPPLLHLKEGRLNRWQLVQQRVQVFWKRWKAECLHEFQIRAKWRRPERNLAVNDLVLVKGEETERRKWPLGRILTVYPGHDGFVRVAEIKTAKGIIKRPATKLIPLLYSQLDE